MQKNIYNNKSRSFSKGGTNVPHLKNTAEIESAQMPVPKQISVSMQQHIGAPCIPCVEKGDPVMVGTLIGDSDKAVSSPIYSGVSGEVFKIDDLMLPNGMMTKTVVINTDGHQTLSDQIVPPVITDRESFLKAIRDSGLVGLGGAGFPAHIKLNPKQKVDTLIINAAECEPYITADYREIIENCHHVINGINLVLKYLAIDRAIVVIEDNKPNAVELLKQNLNDSKIKNINVLKVNSRYPQGAEKVTIFTATGRKVLTGKLPADVGCLVMNVSSVSFVSQYFETGVPLCKKRITVDGSAVSNPKNVMAPVGTYIKDIIAFTGGYSGEPKKIIMGGPMMGVSVTSEDMPILKQNNAILALLESEACPKPLSECFRCGRCVKACPMGLMPVKVETHLKIKDVDALANDYVDSCIECGCCSYACPACRPLVQVMRQAKSTLKKQGGK